ncbi:hypothetical protein [Lysinibacillus sp. FSL W8-0992]|uniref:hypothetical protein n=1 Tax=Lysinibacillus sp. FSL W8-0992 TaxID=2954643 RepID=UPI0030F5440A
MEKIKAFLAYQETTKYKLHRLANANLDICYSNYEMKDLLSLLKEKHAMAKNAGILGIDFYDGICNVQVSYDDFQRLTKGVQDIRMEFSQFPESENEHLYAEVEGIHLVTVRSIEKEKMQAQ